ncbi:MAG: conjugal transfer protein TraF [Gammaproteobacteria bacterium]|nr:conjugal transfer protein TraF [Gammaproteobacteria bacterium]
MNRLILTAVSLMSLLGAMNASAEPINHPLGSHLTTGPLSLPNIGISHTGNPAVGASMLYDARGGFGIGLISSFGMGIEIGPIENVAAQVTTIQTRLSDMQSSISNLAPGALPNLSDISALEKDMQQFLVDMGDSFYLDINAAVDGPTPLVVTHTKFGSFSFDVNAGAKVKLDFLDSPLELNFLDTDNLVATNSSMYLKAGAALELATTYSREIKKFEKGTLYGGLTASYNMVVLQKSLVPFLEYADGLEILQDELSSLTDSGVTGNAVSLDLGVVWSAPYYRLGSTIHNINSPSIAYPVVGKDCEGNNACYTAASFADRIDLEEKYTMNPQISVDAVAHTLSRTWFAGASLDLNPANDYVGDPHQWASISAGYSPHLWSKWFLMPGIRTGFRKNLSGSGMSTVNLGLTWMFAHLDFAYGLTSIDESKVPELQDLNLPISIPRSLAFNAGLHFMF